MKTKIALVFSFTLFIVTLFGAKDYIFDKRVVCKVIDKLTTACGYKHSGSFYLVLSDDKNRVFDLTVSAATFSTCKVDSKYVFEISEMDIKQSTGNNLLYFFLPILLFAMNICLILFWVLED